MTKFMPAAIVLAFALVSGVGDPAAAQAMAKRGEACGGAAGAQCAQGLWCEPPPGQCGAPLKGTCATVPQACTMEYKPVCGCDGHSYSNDCVRRNTRAGLRHRGACRTENLKAN